MRGDDDFDTQVRGLAALAEPVRRDLYRYVVGQAGPVSREEAAKGVGVPRHVAKFHLDKLADEGLLTVEFRRPPGRGGPGAGRPAKRYARSSRQLAVTLPERRYELAGRVLVQAIGDAERDGVPVVQALRAAAGRAGQALGDEAGHRAGARPGRAARTSTAQRLLAELGYEPRAAADVLILANCPFDALAKAHTELVCGMNLDLIGGLLTGLGHAGLRARRDPAPGRCCVTVRQPTAH